MAVLVTGGSGLIGTNLINSLSKTEEVICISRKKPEYDIHYVSGSFDNGEDLRKLDQFPITAVVHLAAVTGGCSEEEGIAVNVLGLRRLISYIIEKHECKKFIIASSIAVVGCLDDDFLPLHFPILEEHPCLAKDAYGLSKYLAEEITKYFSRIHTDMEFINLRLGAVSVDGVRPPERMNDNLRMPCPIVQMSRVFVSDVVRAMEMILAKPVLPGAKVYNIVGPDASCDIPVIDMLHALYGQEAMKQYDLSYYMLKENAYKPLFSTNKIKEEIGFQSIKT